MEKTEIKSEDTMIITVSGVTFNCTNPAELQKAIDLAELEHKASRENYQNTMRRLSRCRKVLEFLKFLKSEQREVNHG